MTEVVAFSTVVVGVGLHAVCTHIPGFGCRTDKVIGVDDAVASVAVDAAAPPPPPRCAEYAGPAAAAAAAPAAVVVDSDTYHCV